MRKSYPLHVEQIAPDIPGASEEYLLYDLRKDRSSNRARDIPPDDMDRAGRVIYPLVRNAEPFPNTLLPANRTHEFRSESFYWKEDSAAVLFADSVAETVEERLSLVLVYTKEAGQRAWTYSVTPDDVCTELDVPAQELTLSDAKILTTPGGLLIRASFSSSNLHCGPRALEISASQFAPAELEVTGPSQHVVPRR